jgi:hypothetical protein
MTTDDSPKSPSLNLIQRHPWVPVLAFYLTFIIVWIWFAWFAIQNSPEVIAPPPPATHGS